MFGGHGTDGGNAYGGGIYSVGGTLTLTGSTISSNAATGGAGGGGADGMFVASMPGGAGGAGGSGYGGGIHIGAGSLTLTNSDLQSNTAQGGAGGGVKLDMRGRRLLHKRMPRYPSWAEDQGVEGVVVVEVTVLPNGLVRSEVSVVQTSGFKELDHLVLEAVKEWSFEELPPGAPAVEQQGRIHFTFDFD